ncbi:MAG: putative transport system permease protein, partial [Gaiellaceae bacterium]|nr:putative transport system permease protein [Gaiellaceae bacterium]
VTAPDVLFQPLNPLVGPAPAQPPAEIAVMPLDTFAQSFGPAVPAITTATPSTAAAPGTQSGVQWQVQAQVDPAVLGGSPAHALARADQIRNAVERSLPGQVVFVDNLSDTLNGAAGDALYAETLYIMLAVPGALVALLLAYLAALGTVERDRRDLALLRARGATRRDLLVLAAAESAAIGVVAGAIGTGIALLAVHWTNSAGGVGTTRILAAFGLCVALAFVGAAAARIGASVNVFRAGVAEGRRSSSRAGKPLWQRLYLDVICLAGSGLVYWLTVRTGFSAVVNPDSNPTLSLSVYMFFAPALLWLGATLVIVRLRGSALTWLAAKAAGGRATTWRGFLLASAGRRGAAINRGLLVVGLLLAFGVNLGVFTGTYDQQARADAQLTLGADVVVSAPPGRVAQRGLQQQVARVPGVASVSPVDHSYAYVGPDLQDTFGVDAATLTNATSLRDSYFPGSSASRAMSRLRSTPDGVLVSKETITDYSLALGDLLKLRVLDRATGKFRIVPFHVVGIVVEFPSAPKDSFMVANLAYLKRVSHDPGPNVLFLKTRGDPAAVAQRVAAATHNAGTLVKDIREQTRQTTSSITTVDLGGISRIEEAFALILAAAAMALFVAVALAERRQELATMAALGASMRQIALFLWSEAGLVLAAALALASLLGWLLAQMLVAMLQHVFDPPPDHLAAPWRFLLGLAAAAVLGGGIACGLAALGIRRLPLGRILREE